MSFMMWLDVLCRTSLVILDANFTKDEKEMVLRHLLSGWGPCWDGLINEFLSDIRTF